jgi:hypothetical protein
MDSSSMFTNLDKDMREKVIACMYAIDRHITFQR